MNSQIFQGQVRHRRFTEVKHQFQYQVFMMLLDLEHIDHVFKKYWLWSINRINIACFKSQKYLKGSNLPLLQKAQELVFNATGASVDHVYLLTNLHYFGYSINPISLYFCIQHNQLTHCIAEVTNTPWAETHAYVLTMQAVKGNLYKTCFKKELHVSPFLTQDYEYKLWCKYSDNKIIVHIQNVRNEQRHFDATLTLHAKPINSRNLALMLLRFPFMTGKVVAAIYWQALKLWCKGVKVNKHKALKS